MAEKPLKSEALTGAGVASDGYQRKSTRATLMSELSSSLEVDTREVKGFQFHSVRRPERRADAPEWVTDSAKFEKYVRHLSSFSTGFNERNNSAKAVLCLYWYYRVGMTAPEIASELGMKPSQVEDWIARRTERGNRFFKRLEEKAKNRGATFRDVVEPANKASA